MKKVGLNGFLVHVFFLFEIYSTTYPFVLSAAIALSTWCSAQIVKELGEVEFSRWQDVKMGLFLSLIIHLEIIFLIFVLYICIRVCAKSVNWQSLFFGDFGNFLAIFWPILILGQFVITPYNYIF